MKSIRLQDILDLFPGAAFYGSKEAVLKTVGSLEQLLPDSGETIYWLGDQFLTRYQQAVSASVGLLLLSSKSYELLQNKPANAIVVNNPKLAFQKVIQHFFADKIIPSIDATAQIAATAVIGKNVFVGKNAVIEDDVVIGNDCFIGHNSVILRGTKIGNSVSVGCNCTIGAAGFGYAKEENESYVQLPHIGNVEIHDGVTIHNNVCIDRAVIGSTIIRSHVKIDNLVHIAHGVEIGENTLVIANCMIGGSTKIGANCWVAPSASLMNKIEVGENAVVGMGAVVIRSIPPQSKVVGNPAKEI